MDYYRGKKVLSNFKVYRDCGVDNYWKTLYEGEKRYGRFIFIEWVND